VFERNLIEYFSDFVIVGIVWNVALQFEGCESVKHGGDVRGMDAEPEPPGTDSRRAP